MAQNLFEPVKPAKYDSDSGDDVADNASSESASSESDSEQEAAGFIIKPSALPAAALNKPGPQSGPKTQPQQLPSSSSDEEDSDEPESDPDGPDPKLNLIASNARGGPKKPNGGAGKPRSKPGASEPDTPAKSTGKKRAAEGKESEAKGAKRSKKKPEPEDSGKKPDDRFRRFFSEDDEIALLNGMIGYSEENKSDPFADLNAFHDFVKADLQADPTSTQLLDKMRKLKTKYEKNKRKEEAGKSRNLKAHERRAYELSKLVCWNEGRKGKKLVKSPKAEKPKKTNGNEEPENGDVSVNGGNLNKVLAAGIGSSNISRIGAQLFEGENRAEGEAEWRKLLMAEMEVYVKKLELMCAKTKLVFDVLNANNC